MVGSDLMMTVVKPSEVATSEGSEEFVTLYCGDFN